MICDCTTLCYEALKRQQQLDFLLRAIEDIRYVAFQDDSLKTTSNALRMADLLDHAVATVDAMRKLK